MAQESIVLIQSFLATYGIGAFFILGFMEEVVFFIPSSLLFLALGFFAIDAGLTPQSAFIVALSTIAFAAACGVLLGALIMYALAYWGGKPLILTYGKYIGIRWEKIEKAGRFFRRGYTDECVLIMLRAVPIFPISVVSVVCGVARIRPLSFISTTFIGTVIRVGTLAFFGWYAGREFTLYADTITLLEQGVSSIILVFVLVFFIVRFKKRKKLKTKN